MRRLTSIAYSLPPRLLLILATSLLVVSCDEDSVLDEVEELKNEVCACKDAACVSALKKNSQNLEKRLSSLSGEEMDKALTISVAMMKCASELGVPENGL